MNPYNLLKISDIEIFKLNIPLKFPFKISLGTVYEADNILVRINTDNDIYGVGEACPSPRITGDTQASAYEAGIHIAKFIKGKDPLAIEARMRDIDLAINRQTQIKSAFNLALYDIIGKATGLPLYRVLGGEKRIINTDYSIGIQENLEIAIDKVKEVINMGFSTLKLKVGLNKDLDINLVKTIRKEISEDISIRTDANQGWDYPTAVQVLKAIEPYNLEYAEQPLPFWDYENMKRLRKTGLAPICADESIFDHHDAFKLASMGACDYLNIKLGKSGGISTALKINAIALSCGIKCMIGCFNESRLGLTAGAHLVSACPNIVFVDLDAALMHKEDPIVGGIEYDVKNNGKIIIPDFPGHGADIKEDFLEDLKHITI
ncbi:MAG: mandelate racemase/muconate lactonizing enzyme family protein [Promethearchaeota archaeon]